MVNFWVGFFLFFVPCSVFAVWTVLDLNARSEKEHLASVAQKAKEAELEAEKSAKIEGLRREAVDNLYACACEIWTQACPKGSKELRRFDLVMRYIRFYETFKSS